MGLTNFPNGLTSFGSVVHGGSVPTLGREFHVRKTTDTGYAAWKRAMDHTVRGGGNSVHTTINSAIAAASDYDTIWVYPGQYKETASIAITQDSLRLLAVQTGPGKALLRTEIRQHGNVETPCITVEGCHNVEIAGFRITPYSSASGIGIQIGNTADTYGTWIHDNYFYAVAGGHQCTHIKYGNASYNADSTYINDNYFLGGGGQGASAANYTIEHVLGYFSVIKNNTFICYGNTTDSITIKVTYSSETIQRLQILDNRFFAYEVGGVLCIDVGGTVDGHTFVDGNRFIGFTANANCYDWDADNSGLNYLGHTAISS